MKRTMRFKVLAGGKTYEGAFDVNGADGTEHLPMMVRMLIRSLAEDQPEILKEKSLSLEASIDP